MQDDVIKVARLICNQMQDDDCACTSACGASIYAARAILDHITALTAERDAAVAEVAEWRECAQYDATMEGPVFKGWDRSQMDRCRKRFIAAGAHKEQ